MLEIIKLLILILLNIGFISIASIQMSLAWPHYLEKRRSLILTLINLMGGLILVYSGAYIWRFGPAMAFMDTNLMFIFLLSPYILLSAASYNLSKKMCWSSFHLHYLPWHYVKEILYIERDRNGEQLFIFVLKNGCRYTYNRYGHWHRAPDIIYNESEVRHLEKHVGPLLFKLDMVGGKDFIDYRRFL